MEQVEQLAVAQPEPYLRHCENIRLPEGILSDVYIGCAGIFVLVEEASCPEDLYLALRQTLGTARLWLYFPASGLYEPLRDAFERKYDDASLTEQICLRIFSETPAWDELRTDTLADRLVRADSLHRGRFTDSDGNAYILRSGHYRPLSDQSSNAMFYLTLFGGVLGLHRFYCGKFFSGLLYLFTGGLCGLGWFLDLLSLFLGVQKDKKKRYYAPLQNPLRKLLLLPFGILCTVGIIVAQLSIAGTVTDMLNASFAGHLQQTPQSEISRLENSIEQFIEYLTTLLGEGN